MAEKRLGRTALTPVHEAMGAKMGEFAGLRLPIFYRSIREECRATRTGAGLFDVSHLGRLRVSGGGASQFLHQITTNDVSRLPPGRVHYTLILTERGGIEGDLLLYHLPPLPWDYHAVATGEEYWLVVNSVNRLSFFDLLRRVAPLGVGVEDETDNMALFALQGPESEKVLSRLTDPSVGKLRSFGVFSAKVGGVNCLVSRTGYTGEDGFEIGCERQNAEQIWNLLLHSQEGAVVPCGLGARDVLRIEAGMPLWGQDMDATTFPHEAGLEYTVKLEKGSFRGRDKCGAAMKAGAYHRLVGFGLQGRRIGRPGSPILVGGAEVGHVTSGTYSFTLEWVIGLGYVRTEHTEPMTPIEVKLGEQAVSGRLMRRPFYSKSQSSG